MKKDQVKNLVGYRIRIRPVARRPGEFEELPKIDDDWIVASVNTELVELSNPRTGHFAVLGLDHIHSFLSDPGRDAGGIKYGFLQLRVQLSLLPHGLDIEPLVPGDWGIDKPVFRSEGTSVKPLAEARLQELITKLFRTTNFLARDEVIEMVYLMGELDGATREVIRDKSSLFLFEHKQFPEGPMTVELWMYRSPDGALKAIYAAQAWEAASRARGLAQTAEDIALLDGLIQGFRRVKTENLRLTIKDVPEFNHPS